jgi:hypothetical protein
MLMKPPLNGQSVMVQADDRGTLRVQEGGAGGGAWLERGVNSSMLLAL